MSVVQMVVVLLINVVLAALTMKGQRMHLCFPVLRRVLYPASLASTSPVS